MALCEIVGGPRDGERFAVPGSLPPERIRVLDTPGPLVMWHPAAAGAYQDVAIVVCELEDRPGSPNGAWRYVWPRQSVTSP